jgi:DNA-binding NtrC family response regulator
LNVVIIEVPPLRSRPEDIALIAQHFLQRYAAKYGKAVKTIDGDALDALQGARWSGNVRELENAIQRAVVMASGPELTVDLLPPTVRAHKTVRSDLRTFDLPFTEAKEAAISTFERSYLEDLLTRTGGNLTEAARRGGLDKSNFRRIIRRHNVDLGRFRPV